MTRFLLYMMFPPAADLISFGVKALLCTQKLSNPASFTPKDSGNPPIHKDPLLATDGRSKTTLATSIPSQSQVKVEPFFKQVKWTQVFRSTGGKLQRASGCFTSYHGSLINDGQKPVLSRFFQIVAVLWIRQSPLLIIFLAIDA